MQTIKNMLELPIKYINVAVNLHTKSLNIHLQYMFDINTSGISNKAPNKLHIVNAIMNMFNGIRKFLFFKNINNKNELDNTPNTNIMNK